MPGELLDELVAAIRRRERVQLLYDRQVDGMTSLHVVAPIDVRPGDTAKTAGTLYVWGWCYAEGKPETHLLSRVRAIHPTGVAYDWDELVEAWQEAGWPLPEDWVVPRESG